MDGMYRSERLRDLLSPSLEAQPSPSLPPDTRPAAVLVPVLTATPEPRLVFTRRSDALSRHAGEISFPGGVADEGEELGAAALREAREELGLASSEVEVLGALPPVHTRVSGILVVPFVGLLGRDPQFTPNAAEIAEVLEYPVAHLFEAGKETALEWEGQTFQAWVYEMGEHVIWGATARILWSFFDLLERAGAASGR
jgi:8-oxo-dGTP pyrophosphatase MutT (NUDIX family)